MARKKQKASIKERIAAWWPTKTKRQAELRKQKALTAFKVVAVMGFLAGTGAFLRYAEGYVRQVKPVEEGKLELLNVPEVWVNWDLKARVIAAAGGDRFPIQADTAEVIARNLASVSWIDDIQVNVTYDKVQVKALWRKPIALIERGASQFYVDADLVVLDYMPMEHLPIVEVRGVRQGLPPEPGSVFDREDLAAAVELIIVLARMDVDITPKNPLLEQIAYIDVSNFNGRRNHGASHLTFTSKDEAQVQWGAEIGEWAKHLEAPDVEKLAKLYTYFKQHGSLGAEARYINLRDPQDKVPQPIDRYR